MTGDVGGEQGRSLIRRDTAIDRVRRRGPDGLLAGDFGMAGARLGREAVEVISTRTPSLTGCIRVTFVPVLIVAPSAPARFSCAACNAPGMGLDNRWAFAVIRQVGNYGDMDERSIAPLGLPRGANALVCGGRLQFAPPVR